MELRSDSTTALPTSATFPRPRELRRHASSPTVKSALRVLEVLEFFDEVQKPANVTAICSSLSYPQSSTSRLLKTMVTMGYLRFNAAGRTYLPTNRVSLMGSWIDDGFCRGSDLYRAMEELGARTGDSVMLAMRNGLRAHYVCAVRSETSGNVPLGPRHYLSTCAAGRALLSLLPDAEAAKILRAINAEAESEDEIVRSPALLADLAQTRARGYCEAVMDAGGGRTGFEVSVGLLVSGSGPLALTISRRSEVTPSQARELGERLMEVRDAIQPANDDIVQRRTG